MARKRVKYSLNPLTAAAGDVFVPRALFLVSLLIMLRTDVGRYVVEVQQSVVSSISSSIPMLSLKSFSINEGMFLSCCVYSCEVRFVVGCTHKFGYCPFIHLYLVAIMDLVLRTDICGVCVAPNSALIGGLANTIDDPGPEYPTGRDPRKGVLTTEFFMDFPIYDRFLGPPLIVNGFVLAYDVYDVASDFFFSVCSDML